MKLKKFKLITILAMIMLATMTTISLGVSSWTPGVGIAAGWGSGIYCTEHEATLAPTVTYGKATKINYGGGGSEAADITVAYALYLGLTGSDLQNVIWASPNNTGVHVELTNERVKEYKKVYEEIFQKSGSNVVTHTENADNLKVLVDRTKGTYAVGPYKLDLTAKGASADAKSKLLNEIKTGKEGTPGVYATFTGITGINGTIQELVYADGSKVASSNGLSYGFPDFGKEFYIRFKPNNDGAIISTGVPNFHLKFMTNVTGTVTKFDATSVDYELNGTYQAAVISKAKGQANFPNPPDRGEPNTTHTQNVNVDVEIKIELKHHSGSVIAVDTKHETVPVSRDYGYDGDGKLAWVGGKKVTWTATSTRSQVPVSNHRSYTTDVQTLSNESGGVPEWHEDNNEEPNIPNEPVEYENSVGYGYDYEAKPSGVGIKLPEAQIDMQIGGHVWLEEAGEKTGEPDGKKTNKDKPFAGIQVDLYLSDGKLVTTTTTDKNGKYRFYGRVGDKSLLNPLKQYYVVFEYDGQRYQATYSYSNIASPGGYSNAREVNREEYNAKFKLISAHPDNYKPDEIKPTGATAEIKAYKRAYGIDHKIAKDDGQYATTGAKNDEGKEIALTYEDVYNKFLELSTSSEFGDPKQGDNRKEWTAKQNSYYSAMNGLKNWLKEKGVNNEFESIQSFIFDSLMKSSTQKDQAGNTILYPKYDKFVLKELYNTGSNDYKNKTTKTIKLGDTYTYLYSINYDMARYVDFGLWVRPVADIRLQKDLYKATLIVNGKKEVYEYAKRDLSADPNNKNWDIRVRASDALYNGTKAYRRDVRGSEYLLGKENLDEDIKMLRAYVTYRIAFKNNGDTNVKVNEIVDHYDKDGYVFDKNDRIISENTYIGDYEGNKIKDVGTNDSGTFTDKYNNLYLTGMNETLRPGSVSWVYVTFKVATDESGRIKLDYTTDPATTKKNELTVGVGKSNIAEINAYETYYVDSNQSGIREKPDYLVNGKDRKNENVAGKVAGLIDYNSNPGSLSSLDLDADGNLIVTRTSKVIEGKAGIIASDRQEDDSSQAPNVRLIITPSPDDGGPDETRKFKGYVFEDDRTDNSSGATIGNGEYQDNEAKINGVKVELVEIVSEVDDIGVSKHTYTGEKVWLSHTYNGGSKVLEETDNKERYSSGDGYSKIIINGPKDTIFEIFDHEELGREDGQYALLSIPAGDFFIRYTYGDDDGTTVVKTEALTNQKSELESIKSNTSDSKEKQGLQEAIDRKQENIDVNNMLGASGRNAKSYNGQDYKSTVYQQGISQEGNYYDIKGYKDYEKQNYTEGDAINDGTHKDSMYYYDIVPSSASTVVSDAKDVWYYRNRSNEYGKGADLGSGNKVLLNKRAETLASFEKLSSYASGAGEIKSDGTSYSYTDNGAKVYDKNNSYYKEQQRGMLDEFEKNTYMVAQSGIINTEIELNRNESVYDLDESKKDTRTLLYTIDNINLGLTERPKAQLKLNKKVDNYTLALYSGTVLFDANKSQNNLSFSGHVEHTADKDGLGLFKLGQPRLGRPGDGNSEIIQNYVDVEFLQNIVVNLKYKLFVENVGETDYTDKKFYYAGIEDNAEANTSKTAAVRVVDYVSNELGFSGEGNNGWNLSSAEQLMPSKEAGNEESNFVNRVYNDELNTYKTLITTDSLGDQLKPGQRKEIDLQLSNQLVDVKERNNVFCNMAEIVATSNDVGRRCAFSISGNEEMADQLLGNNAASETRTALERIQVKEIDADSSQEVKILPPTGTESKKMLDYKSNNTVKGGLASILSFMKR